MNDNSDKAPNSLKTDESVNISAEKDESKCLQRSSSVLSTSSIASSTSSNIPVKKSGIKPPSRIERPCAAQQQKPGVPTSPTQNSSAILTEDTDSFIIGQRVWVGGTKPGVIAFIGETQFAPGEWAGIALDEAIGKNDGSVAGIRYFQCEPKKGVFSRLTRLSRVPLEQPYYTNSSESFTTPPHHNGVRSPISPTGSTRSLLKSPLSHYTSNTSLASTSTSHPIDYKIGDRVIIKSSQGSKVGTVRYIGYTEFAPGEWVGVELDDPRGKNDGSVAGKRYFTCENNFGLFAPISKVSKSPSKIKPGACAVHNPNSTPGLPPSGLRRAGSKESMTSGTSSVRRKTSTRVSTSISTPRPSLQEIIKDKQYQIEQLLKERDLERQEFTKAANQAEEAERQINELKNQFEKYRIETEKKLQDYVKLSTDLKELERKLAVELEDEKRKNEDLLFKFEEASIIKSDLEAVLEKNTLKIKELESIIQIEKTRSENGENDSKLKVELEENLKKAKEIIEELTKEKRSTEEDNVMAKDQIEKLQKELEVTKRQLEELNNIRNDSSLELTSLKIEHDKIVQNFKEIEEKLATSEKEFALKNSQLENLEKELNVSKENSSQLENELENLKKIEEESNREKEKLKMEISSKIYDLQNLNEELKGKEENIRNLNGKIEELNEKVENFEKNCENSREFGEVKNKEIELLKKELEEMKISSTKQIEINEKISRENEIFQKEMEKMKNLQEHNEKLQEKLESTESNLRNKENELSQLLLNFESVKKEVVEKNDNFVKINSKLEELRKNSSEIEANYEKIKEEKQHVELENGDLKRNIESLTKNFDEQKSQNIQLQNEIKSLIHSSGDHSAKLEEMQSGLMEKQRILEETRHQYQENVKNLEHKIQENEQKMAENEIEFGKLAQKLQKMEGEIDEKNGIIQTYQENLEDIRGKNEEYRKVVEVDEERIRILEEENKKKIEEFEKNFEDSVDTKRKFEENFEKLSKENEELREKMDGITKENEVLRSELQMKNNNIGENLREIDEIKKNFEGKELELKEKIRCFEEIEVKSSEEFKEKIDSFENEIKIKNLEIEKLNENLKDLMEKSEKLSEYQRKIEMYESELKKNENEQNEIRLELKNLREECEKKGELQSNFENSLKEIENLKAEIVKISKENSELTEKSKFNDEKLSEQMKILNEKYRSLTETSKVEKDKLEVLLKENREKDEKIMNFSNELNAFEILKNEKNSQIELLMNAMKSFKFTKNQKEEILGKINISNVDCELKEIFMSLNDEYVDPEDENKLKDLENYKMSLMEERKNSEKLKIEMENLKKQVKELQERTDLKVTEVKNINNNEKNDDYQQLLEEKNLVEGEVKFLNSIIVDMKKKNEEQKAKIEILESGFSPAAADELNLLGYERQNRQIAPRMFCDICDCFDLHDTEDCPQQMSEGMPPPPPPSLAKHDKKKEKPPPRPYCELCEVFGHDTQDCQEDETF